MQCLRRTRRTTSVCKQTGGAQGGGIQGLRNIATSQCNPWVLLRFMLLKVSFFRYTANKERGRGDGERRGGERGGGILNYVIMKYTYIYIYTYVDI